MLFQVATTRESTLRQKREARKGNLQKAFQTAVSLVSFFSTTSNPFLFPPSLFASRRSLVSDGQATRAIVNLTITCGAFH